MESIEEQFKQIILTGQEKAKDHKSKCTDPQCFCKLEVQTTTVSKEDFEFIKKMVVEGSKNLSQV